MVTYASDVKFQFDICTAVIKLSSGKQCVRDLVESKQILYTNLTTQLRTFLTLFFIGASLKCFLDEITKFHAFKMSAIFNFQSLLSVILLLICTCAYLRSFFPSIMDRNKTGLLGTFWKCARIGERKSPYVAISCVLMAFSILFLT